jgi:1-pyrroline-5-carboxylate dehydrogenase
MSAVIDATSFAKSRSYIEGARSRASCTILAGGQTDDSRGYFVAPTLIQTTNPGVRQAYYMRTSVF